MAELYGIGGLHTILNEDIPKNTKNTTGLPNTYKDYTKEDLEKITGMRWLDHEVEWLNQMMKAHREGQKLVIMPARGTIKNKLMKAYLGICAAEDTYNDFYKWFTEGEDEVYFDEEANKIVREQLKAESVKRKYNIYDYYKWRIDEDEQN